MTKISLLLLYLFLQFLFPIACAQANDSSSSSSSSKSPSTDLLLSSDERVLQETDHLISQSFQYRRHEWTFSSVKYSGFLRFFAENWRLLARLGGTYEYEGSPYYSRWSWEEALANLVNYLDDLESYYRVYRHLKERPELRDELIKRHPDISQVIAAFLEFMSDRDTAGQQEAGYPAYLSTAAPRYRWLRQLAAPGCSGTLGDAVRTLLASARQIVAEAASRTDQSDADSLVAIATNYTELSVLAWDRIPTLALAEANSGNVGMCRAAGGNYSQSNVTQAAAWLSRQVLGHVLLYLRQLQQHVKRALTEFEATALSNLYCRVVREDIDKSLEMHLEVREMIELQQLLDTCRTVKLAADSAYSELDSLWRSLRLQIWREYSAFRQYSNRVPAILSAKAAARVALPVIAAIGLVLNSLIIAHLVLNRAARQVGRNVLIALLACFDSLILLTSCLVLFTDRYMEHDQDLKPNPGTDLWCKFQAYLLNLTVESSAFIVVILSVERFLAVYSLFRRHQPESDQPQSNKELPRRKLSIMALCAFCFACIFNCMLIIGDEAAAPAKSTLGRQCVHYVRLRNFQSNLAYVTRVKPLLNALARSLLPYSLVCLLSLATCWLLFKKGAYQSLRQQQQQQQQQLNQDADYACLDQSAGGQLNRAIGQLGLACAYLALTAPAPVVYTLFMTAHADRLTVRLTNGLYDEADPAFRTHWARIGRLTVVQYATEYALVPLCAAAVNFCALCLADANFRRFLVGLAPRMLRRWRQSRSLRLQQLQQLPIVTAEDWDQTEII